MNIVYAIVFEIFKFYVRTVGCYLFSHFSTI